MSRYIYIYVYESLCVCVCVICVCGSTAKQVHNTFRSSLSHEMFVGMYTLIVLKLLSLQV